uniref:Uncharacterized protein n=1 Tax=Salix viminalis TaxID=40686 RepID=A0A6N2MY91_SALVM
MFTKLTCTKFNSCSLYKRDTLAGDFHTSTKFNSCSLYKRDTLAGDFHTSTKVSNTASEVATLGIVGKFALSAGGATRLSSPNKAGVRRHLHIRFWQKLWKGTCKYFLG